MNFTAIDFETANIRPSSICQVGIVVVEDCKIVDRISYLVKPKNNEYFQKNIDIHGRTPDKTKDADSFDTIYSKIKVHIEGKKVVAHNASFDMRCLEKALGCYKIPYPKASWFCTYKIYKSSLSDACKRNGIVIEREHDALSDAEACALLMIRDVLKSRRAV